MMLSLNRARRAWRVAVVGLVVAAVGAVGPSSSLAQTLVGRVSDAADGSPLPGAHVHVQGASIGTVTGDDGRFRLVLPAPGTVTVVARFVGYSPTTRTLTVDADDVATWDAVLTAVPIGVDELVVVGTRVALLDGARSVATLDGDALDRTRGQTLGETLAQVPGVSTLSTGPSIDKPVIRGLHSDRVVVLNHGVRQEGQQWGGEHAPEIDPFAPAEIHVVKGAAGVEYGVGAIGGVVRLEPHALPTTAGVHGDLTLNGFSNNWQGAGSLRLEGGVPGADGWGWRAHGSLRRAGDARTPDAVIVNSAFAEANVATTVGYTGDRFEAEIHASRFDTELGIYRGAHVNTVDALRRAIDEGPQVAASDFSYRIDAPKQAVTHDLITLTGRATTTSGNRLEVQYGVQRNHRREFDAHCRFCDDPGADPAFDLTLVTHSVDAAWRSRPIGATGHTALIAGVSGMNQGNTNGESGYLIPNFRALTGGGFLRGTWSRGDWTVDAGTRADVRWLRAFPRALGTGGFERRVTDYTGVSGVVGVSWRFAPTWSLGVNASTAWRPPSVNELYSNGVHHGSAQFEVGDPTLRTERLTGVDATLRHVGSRVRMDVSGYFNRGRDFIQLVPSRDTVVTIRGVFPAFGYRQSAVVLRGIDGSVEVDATPWLTTGVTGALVRATDTDADAPVFGMPSDRATLFATLRLPEARDLSDVDLRVESTLVRTQTRVPDDVDYAEPPDGYALVGASVGGTVRMQSIPVTVRLSVENLLNTTYRDYLSRYRYFVDEPGRTVVLRLRVPFGGDRWRD